MILFFFQTVLNVCTPLLHNAFSHCQSQRQGFRSMARWTPLCILPELASVVELGCAKEVCLLPRFLPLYKLFTSDLAARGGDPFFFPAAVEIRLLDSVLQI